MKKDLIILAVVITLVLLISISQYLTANEIKKCDIFKNSLINYNTEKRTQFETQIESIEKSKNLFLIILNEVDKKGYKTDQIREKLLIFDKDVNSFETNYNNYLNDLKLLEDVICSKDPSIIKKVSDSLSKNIALIEKDSNNIKQTGNSITPLIIDLQNKINS